MRKLTIFVLLMMILPGVSYAQDSLAVQLPELTGPYAVGKVDLHLIDNDREEIFTDDADDLRELMVTVYYPADAAEGAEPAPYMEGALLDAIARANGIPPILLSNIHANSYAEAPVSEAMSSYPVLIFSPGFGNQPVFYTSLLEETASYGYIIVSMHHPYSTGVTVYPDDHVAVQNQSGNIDITGSDEAKAKENMIGSVWVADALFVLNQLTEWSDSDPMFAGRLDLDHIGMFGHSFGGATSAEAMALDERINAAINVDGGFFGSVQTEPITRPFMLMRSADLEITDELLEANGITRADAEKILAEAETEFAWVIDNATEGYFFQLAGSVHNTYTTDMPQFAEAFPFMLGEDLVGSIDADRGFEIISTYVRAFFDTYLKDSPSTLLDGPSDEYPEVTFEQHSTE